MPTKKKPARKRPAARRRPTASRRPVARGAKKGKQRNPSRDANAVIRAHFMRLMPKSVQSQLQGAQWDLYNGPLSKADARAEGIRGWKGFSHAVDVLNDWASEHLGTIYYDHGSDSISDQLDEGYWEGSGEDREWIEPYLDETQEYNRRALERIVFGSELARTM
jgi:hypothetical protein